MSSLENFKSKIVKDVDGKEVEFGTFWRSADGSSPHAALIFLLRRFGCPLCRWQAANVSVMAEQLKEKGVRLVAVAPERLGIEEFLQGGYWKGEVYYDETKTLYNGLGMGRVGLFGTLGSIFQKAVRDRAKEAEKQGITGNLKGDGQQLGGCYLLDGDGHITYEWHQKDFMDEPDIAEIASKAGVTYAPSGAAAPECTTACALPAKN